MPLLPSRRKSACAAASSLSWSWLIVTELPRCVSVAATLPKSNAACAPAAPGSTASCSAATDCDLSTSSASSAARHAAPISTHHPLFEN